jgi:hypothetical protein
VSGKTGVRIGLALIVLVSCLSCGFKTPPRLPKAVPPPKVEDLRGNWAGRQVVLKGKTAAPGQDEGGDAAIVGARVYHAWYAPGKRPCEGCPVSSGGYIEAVPERDPSGAIVCRVPLQKDAGTHFFEVRLVGRGNAVGPASDRIMIVVERPSE